MSTYLVAFLVSDFSYKETSFRTQNGIEKVFRVWSRPDAIDQADYALQIGPKLVSFFEGYFDIEFPLPKIDLVAVPDFDNGAMENWGLIIFKYEHNELIIMPRFISFKFSLI
jgi:aminopeptidase N